VLTLDEESFRGLIDYVQEAKRLLDALGTDLSGRTFAEGDARSVLMRWACRSWFRYRDSDNEFTVAFDPFAVWAGKLFWLVELEGLDCNDVTSVEICPHRKIAFRTADGLFNPGKNGTFPCESCSEPSSVFALKG
jgi:hypothetical protein